MKPTLTFTPQGQNGRALQPGTNKRVSESGPSHGRLVVIGEDHNAVHFEYAVALTENAVQAVPVDFDRLVAAIRQSEVFLNRRCKNRIVVRRFGHAEGLMPGKVEVGKF